MKSKIAHVTCERVGFQEIPDNNPEHQDKAKYKHVSNTGRSYFPESFWYLNHSHTPCGDAGPLQEIIFL